MASFGYTFNSDNEGWRYLTGNGNQVLATTWSASSGNPGGGISVFDNFNAAFGFIETPTDLPSGNSANFGGTLSFDIKSSSTWALGWGAFLFGPGNGGNPYCIGDNTAPTTTFHTYSFTMNGANVFLDDCSTNATDEQVAQLLGSLQAIQFPAEDGPNTSKTTTVDNVILSGGSAPVEHTLMVTKNGTGAGTVTSSPVGIDCGATCSNAFFDNRSVTLTATPAAGSEFTGWSGSGCSGTGTCQVTMSADRPVTATFALQIVNVPRTLTLSYSKAKKSFKGTLKAPVDPATCAAGQKVTIFKKHKGPDPKLGSPKTDPNGVYKLKDPGKNGTYYASIAQKTSGQSICKAAKSGTVQLG
jgi:hypothetical protein